LASGFANDCIHVQPPIGAEVATMLDKEFGQDIAMKRERDWRGPISG
jgi:hypothetical protein